MCRTQQEECTNQQEKRTTTQQKAHSPHLRELRVSEDPSLFLVTDCLGDHLFREVLDFICSGVHFMSVPRVCTDRGSQGRALSEISFAG